jgi:hypothetical protein
MYFVRRETFNFGLIITKLMGLFIKIPLKVTKTIEETMTTNEIKYKNILNHHGNVHGIDFDSLV